MLLHGNAVHFRHVGNLRFPYTTGTSIEKPEAKSEPMLLLSQTRHSALEFFHHLGHVPLAAFEHLHHLLALLVLLQ